MCVLSYNSYEEGLPLIQALVLWPSSAADGLCSTHTCSCDEAHKSSTDMKSDKRDPMFLLRL